jgi:putative DNA primase/helicase
LQVRQAFSPDSIPEELRGLPRWLCWRSEIRDGKPTKTPLNPRTGDFAKVNDTSTWAPFNFAVQEAGRAGWGIGFVFGDSDLVGIDLDHVRDPKTGAIIPKAQAIIDDVGGYAEVSPSGTGVHVIARGTLAQGARNRVPLSDGTGLEVYASGRYFTMTGNVIHGHGVIGGNSQPGIDRLVAKYLPPRTNGKARPDVADVDRAGVVLADDAIIHKARGAKNGAKFARLFDTGSLTEYDGDDSRADLALIAMLMFWTRDADQLDRLFRQSKLYRDKWDRPDYRERTITAALANVIEIYSGKRTRTTAPDGAAPFADTDTRNAERFAAQHGADVRWCEKWRRWLAWDGKRWTEDAATITRRRAGLTARSIYREVADVENDGERAGLRKWAKHSESAQGRHNMIELARSEEGIEIKTDELDRDPSTLNVENGTLDLRTGELRPHRREDFLTKLAPVTFDPTATCPTFDRFLSEVMDGRADLVDYLHRALGYGMTGDVREHCLFFFHGRGRNGKSTLLNIIRHVMGEYSTECAPDLLLMTRSDRHPTERAALAGKRFASTVEVEDGRRFAEVLVKQLTGGDPITARRMREDFWTFMPTWKIFLAANHRPTIRGTDDAIWTRIHLVPFDVSFNGREDRDLPAKLQAERAGILAWLVRGAVEWHRRGLDPIPDAMRAAVESYRAEMDTIGAFLTDCCDLDPKFSENAGELFRRYELWAKETGGEDPVNSTVFGRRLTSHGYGYDRTEKGRYRRGLRLKMEELEPGSNG